MTDRTLPVTLGRKCLLIALAFGVAGCASSGSSDTAALLAPAATASPSSTSNLSKAGYTLSAEEQALECKQLTGRMQIRILEIRDYNERNRTSMASRALQTGATTVFGGPKQGLDPNGAYTKDRAMLEAYNQQLLAKSCRTYDLEAELTPQDVRATPNATIKPAN